MLNDLLNYNFKIYQDSKYFKFSIDSVLLAEFVDIKLSTKNILDLCTGNAPIPMILSSKTDKNIYGIEIQKGIYELGLKSIIYNNIKNVHLINEDLNNINDVFSFKFDIITCNPPYFKFNTNKVINKNDVKSIARHEIKCNLEDVIRVSSENLNNMGSLFLVQRTERFFETVDLFKKYNFGIRKVQFVYDNENSNSCIFLIEGKYQAKDDLKMLKPLFIKKYLGGIK